MMHTYCKGWRTKKGWAVSSRTLADMIRSYLFFDKTRVDNPDLEN